MHKHQTETCSPYLTLLKTRRQPSELLVQIPICILRFSNQSRYHHHIIVRSPAGATWEHMKPIIPVDNILSCDQRSLLLASLTFWCFNLNWYTKELNQCSDLYHNLAHYMYCTKVLEEREMFFSLVSEGKVQVQMCTLLHILHCTAIGRKQRVIQKEENVTYSIKSYTRMMTHNHSSFFHKATTRVLYFFSPLKRVIHKNWEYVWISHFNGENDF